MGHVECIEPTCILVDTFPGTSIKKSWTYWAVVLTISDKYFNIACCEFNSKEVEIMHTEPKSVILANEPHTIAAYIYEHIYIRTLLSR